jgi:hypothetical protein
MTFHNEPAGCEVYVGDVGGGTCPEALVPYLNDRRKLATFRWGGNRILDVAARKRNGARWSVALALGIRQGEALGVHVHGSGVWGACSVVTFSSLVGVSA